MNIELTFKRGIFTQMFAEKQPRKVERFHKYYDLIRTKLLNELGHDVVPGDIFDSGYQGFTFFINGIKCLVIDQEGVTGLEDHRTAYLDIIVNGKTKRFFTHKAKHFGDTGFNQNEIDYISKNISEWVLELYEEAI